MKHRIFFFSLFIFQYAFSQQGKIYHDGHGGFVYFPLGAASFADEVTEVVPGNPSTPYARFLDKKNLVGEPDYDIEQIKNIFSLGCRGSVILKFTDNALIDIEGPDLYVFEVGSNIEPTKLAISENGKTWIDVGEISGGRAEIDIHDFVKPGQIFHYVQLTDLGKFCDPRESYPGAEIDGVGAIGSATNISLDNTMLFATGQYTLRSTAQTELNKVVEELKKFSDYTIRIEGHTDSDGDEKNNQTLSEKRAESVKNFLVSKGVNKTRIITAGYGELLPVADNETEEGKQQNRRVNILIIPAYQRPYFDEEHNTLMMVYQPPGDDAPNGKWLKGYPKAMTQKEFPGVWTNHLDEVMVLDDKIWFFHGDSVACMHRDTRVMEKGFPKTVQAAFPGIWKEGIDMALVAKYDGMIYFVHKGEIFVWDVIEQKAVEGYPMKISGSKWENKFPPGVTACFQPGEQVIYFFAGAQFYRAIIGSRGLGDYQLGGLTGENPGFGPLWPSGVDAVTDWDGRHFYFFRNH